MEELKEKILDTLLSKISISDFEIWLYSQDELINLISHNNFIYRLVTINYKKESSYKHLEDLAIELCNEDEYMLLLTERTCQDIIAAKTSKEILSKSFELVQKFNYNSDYELIWEIYLANNKYNLVETGYLRPSVFNLNIKTVSKKILSELENCSSLQSKIQFVKDGFL